MKIKKNDLVVVVAGRDRGRTGVVIAAYPDRGKVLVQGVNMVKKNKKVTHQGRAVPAPRKAASRIRKRRST